MYGCRSHINLTVQFPKFKGRVCICISISISFSFRDPSKVVVGCFGKVSWYKALSSWPGPWNPPAHASGALELQTCDTLLASRKTLQTWCLLWKIDLSKAHRSGWHIVLCSSIRMFSGLYGSFALFQSGKHAGNTRHTSFYGTAKVWFCTNGATGMGVWMVRGRDDLGKPWSLNWRFKEQKELVLLGNYEGKEQGDSGGGSVQKAYSRGPKV